jgi:hypothetical protein
MMDVKITRRHLLGEIFGRGFEKKNELRTHMIEYDPDKVVYYALAMTASR